MGTVFPFGAANCTFDVYRGYNPGNPYQPPNVPAVQVGVEGVLWQHVRNGRFGSVLAGSVPIHWTTIVEVPVGTDIRSGYDSELNAFPEAGGGDTLLMTDYPIAGTCCAFCVVMVQRRGRGTALDHLRLYLDRAQPRYGQDCEVVESCCGISASHLYVVVTDLGGCGCLAGVWPLIGGLNGDGTGNWIDPNNKACSGNHFFLQLFCNGSSWSFEAACSTNTLYGLVPPETVSCSPFELSFGASTVLNACCHGQVSVVITDVANVSTTCCPSLPSVLHATLSNVGSCACLDGLVIPIYWDPGGNWWFGNVLAEGCSGSSHEVGVYLSCDAVAGTWSVQVRIGLNNEGGFFPIPSLFVCEESGSVPVSSFTCSPPFWSFPSVPIAYNALNVGCPSASDPSFPCNGPGSTGTLAVTITA